MRVRRVLFGVAVLLVLLALSFGSLMWVQSRNHTGAVAKIYHNGELVSEIDLNRVEHAKTLVLTGERGESNTIQMEPGRIRIREASCPDQICVHQGWISSGALPLVCLPNHVVVEIVGKEGEVDVIAG